MKFKESVSSKIAAIIFSYIMVLVLVISAIGIGVMASYKFYFSDVDALTEEILSDMAQSEAYHISNKLDWGEKDDLKSYYRNKNVYYKIVFLNGEERITNYAGQPYIASATTGYYEYGAEYTSVDKYGNVVTHQNEVHLADIEVYIDKELHKNDIFSAVAKIIEIGYSLRFAIVFIGLGAMALFIYLLCFLYCAAGHKTGGVIKCNYLDKMPFDFMTAIVAVIAFFSFWIIYETNNDIELIIVLAIIGSIDYFVALGYTMSFATRIKTQTLIKNNILYYVFSFIGAKFRKFFGWLKFVFRNASLLQKAWIVVLAVLVSGFLFTVIVLENFYHSGEGFILFMFILIPAICLCLLYLAVVCQKIKRGGEEIAKGDLQHKIDTKYMFGDFKEFAESLNNINEGLSIAVNEKMKSERFKTELITNVSHDIKTPLTSIINYVDLIKKEDIENETALQYIEVLDRQSNRLKKLVEDLVEASKASSGALGVELTPCDVSVLLTQTLGEFEDRLLRQNIIPVITIPDNSVKIMADGRHLWRIFDNLMGNICKYAMGGTRAYIDVQNVGEKAVITFRNISKNQLNVTADELMERFVRGDKSRNTEGSGLGLSIAKSLAELQKGNLELSVDGDLFKVTVTFNLI